MASPQLVVNQQDSLAKLLLTTKTGVPRDVHVVVKNTPFNIVLGVANNLPRNRPERIDLSKSTISVDVHYDSDDPKEGKQVKLMTSKPCEYKVHLSDKRFDEATLEVRMKVLTSQHEDMLFRLHLTLTNEHHVIRTTTAAIKVVSKPDQVRRINGEKGKKRTHSDVVNESLERIEKRQQQQQALLLQILKNGDDHTQMMNPAPAPMQQFQQQQQPSNNTVSIQVPSYDKKPAEDNMSFEAAFSLCMKKYAALPQNERPSKLRKVVTTSNARDSRSIAEFSEVLRVEGGLRSFPDPKKNNQVPNNAAPPVSMPPPASHMAAAPVVHSGIAPSSFCAPQQQQQQQQQQPTPQSLPVKAESQSENPCFSTTDFPLSGSLSFSEDPALTSEFVQDMFQNAALSPFHF